MFCNSESLESVLDDPDSPFSTSRSASQRLVDRKGRAALQKSKFSEEDSVDLKETNNCYSKGRSSKFRMSSKWRRSKSQDRDNFFPESKSKEKQTFKRLEEIYDLKFVSWQT